MLVTILVTLFLVGFNEGGVLEVVVSDFPHAAFLNIQCLSQAPNLSIAWRCGSSVVNQYLMLTAAHCLYTTTCDEIAITVTVGQTNNAKGIKTSVHSFILHEHYYTTKFQADIALLRLIAPLELNAQVSRVVLMPNPPYEEMGEIVGWNGILPITESTTNDYIYSIHHIWKKQECMDIPEDLPNGTFCVTTNNTEYVFNTDIGSALVVLGYIQIGICSYVEPKNEYSTFIFTDVGYYYKWIRDTAVSIMFENIDKGSWQACDFNETYPTDENDGSL